MKERAALCAVLILWSSIHGYAEAAHLSADVGEQPARFSVSLRGDQNCVIDLNGPISLGDSERFKQFLESLADDNPFTEDYFRRAGHSHPELLTGIEGGFRPTYLDDGSFHVFNQAGLGICLNSEGGSFSEAIKLFDLVYDMGLGTVVPDGAKCLSACAVVFLAGRLAYETTMGGNLVTAKNRRLHARALLGFHAPSLNVTVPNPPAEAISEAYSDAIKQNAGLINRLSDNELPILRRMLSTPPEKMDYVTDVESSLAIEMKILGFDAPTHISFGHILAACANAALAYITLVSKYEPLGRVRNAGPDQWLCEMPESYREIDPQTPVNILKSRKSPFMLVAEASVPAINCKEPGKTNVCRPVLTTDAYGYTGAQRDRYTKVSVGFWETSDTNGIALQDLPDHPDAPEPFFTWDSDAHILFPPNTKLVDLPH